MKTAPGAIFALFLLTILGACQTNSGLSLQDGRVIVTGSLIPEPAAAPKYQPVDNVKYQNESVTEVSMKKDTASNTPLMKTHAKIILSLSQQAIGDNIRIAYKFEDFQGKLEMAGTAVDMPSMAGARLSLDVTPGGKSVGNPVFDLGTEITDSLDPKKQKQLTSTLGQLLKNRHHFPEGQVAVGEDLLFMNGDIETPGGPKMSIRSSCKYQGKMQFLGRDALLCQLQQSGATKKPAIKFKGDGYVIVDAQTGMLLQQTQTMSSDVFLFSLKVETNNKVITIQ